MSKSNASIRDKRTSEVCANESGSLRKSENASKYLANQGPTHTNDARTAWFTYSVDQRFNWLDLIIGKVVTKANQGHHCQDDVFVTIARRVKESTV